MKIFKNTLTIAILVLTLYSCKAQTVIYNIDTPPEDRTVTDNYYYKDINNYNDAVVGIWVWEDGTNRFEITLQEFEMYSEPISPNIYCDEIYGKYKYEEDGVIISEVEEIGTFTDAKFAVAFNTPTVYFVTILDVVSTRAKKGTFTITSPTTAVLELRDIGGIKLDFTPNGEFRLPTSITLTKQ